VLVVRWDTVELEDLDVSLPAEGGPRANSPASAGLNRPASLPPKASFAWVRGGVPTCFGVVVLGSSWAGEGEPVEVSLTCVALGSTLPRSRLFARASGISDT